MRRDGGEIRLEHRGDVRLLGNGARHVLRDLEAHAIVRDVARRNLPRLRGRGLAHADHGRFGDAAVDVLARNPPVAAGTLDARRLDPMLLKRAADGGGETDLRLSVPRRRPGPRSADRRFPCDRLRCKFCIRGPGLRRGTAVDPPQHGAGRRLVIRVKDDLGEHAGRGRRHLLRHLVGLELDQRLVLEHQVADLPQPRADDRLGALLLFRDRDVDH